MMNQLESSSVKSKTKQVWGTNPAGWTHAKDKQTGTKDFFDQVLKKRFSYECNWLPEVIHFEKYKDKKVLEIGCGAGYDAYMFCKAGAQYTGIDLVSQNIELTKQHLFYYGYQSAAAICQMDAEHMIFDKKFDLIYSFGVLHHISDIDIVLKKSYEFLNDQGKVIFIVYNRNSLVYWVHNVFLKWIMRGRFLKESLDSVLEEVEDVGSSQKPLVRVYAKKNFSQKIKQAGFKVIEVKIRKLVYEDLPGFRFLFWFYRIIPQCFLYQCSKFCGWYLCVEAIKE